MKDKISCALGGKNVKPSKYNFIIQHQGKTLIYNTLNSSLVEINPLLTSLLEQERIEVDRFAPFAQGFLREMAKNGFIIDDEIDEIKILKNIFNKARYRSNILELVIAPTMACNFNCSYCFEQGIDVEQGSPIFMSEEVQQALLCFVKKNIKGKTKLRITWYGGEPMLAYDIIFNLSEKLIKIAEENNVAYLPDIITNGYVIGQNPALIEKLILAKIKYYQITLDGTPEIHNQRRCLKSNPEKGTFDTIMKGIEALNKDGLMVSVRINVDSSNTEDAQNLLDIFEEKGLKDVCVYVSPVQKTSVTGDEISECPCLTNEDVFQMKDDFDKLLKKKGFKVFENIPRMHLVCCANLHGAFVIDPDGDLYKCFWEISHKEKSCGSLINEHSKLQRFQEIKYITWEPFEFAQCLECKALPVCMGGCPDRILRNQGKPDCSGQDNIINHITKSIKDGKIKENIYVFH